MTLPVNVQTVDTTRLDSLRNRLAARLANAALLLATEDYRGFVSGSIHYGVKAAILDVKRMRGES